MGFIIINRLYLDILRVIAFYSGINHQKGFIFALYIKA